MCFNLPYTLKKGKLIIVRKWNEEEKEDVGLLVKEIAKWNKIHRDNDPAFPSTKYIHHFFSYIFLVDYIYICMHACMCCNKLLASAYIY